jgi:BMFP domain-containing protein YqiC
MFWSRFLSWLDVQNEAARRAAAQHELDALRDELDVVRRVREQTRRDEAELTRRIRALETTLINCEA